MSESFKRKGTFWCAHDTYIFCIITVQKIKVSVVAPLQEILLYLSEARFKAPYIVLGST